MKTRTGLCITFCGSLLLGCTSLTDGSLAFWKTPPKFVMTADGEYQRGREFHVRGQYSEAQKAYLSALAIDSQHAEAKNAMAALTAAIGDLDRAIGMLVELGQRYPKSHVFANLGHAYQMRGKLFDAREAYQRAVDLDPSNEEARRKLAALEQQLGAKAVVEAPAVSDPAHDAHAGAIDLVTSGVYAMRYPTGTAATPDSPAADLLNATASPVPVPPVSSLVPPVATSTATSTETRKSETPRAPARTIAVELVNGNGVNGLARELRTLLPRGEWTVVRTANHSDFWVPRTRIEYLPPNKPAARRLAEEIGLPPRLRMNDELPKVRLRVVLGHDFKDLESLRQRLAADEPQPAAESD